MLASSAGGKSGSSMRPWCQWSAHSFVTTTMVLGSESPIHRASQPKRREQLGRAAGERPPDQEAHIHLRPPTNRPENTLAKSWFPPICPPAACPPQRSTASRLQTTEFTLGSEKLRPLDLSACAVRAGTSMRSGRTGTIGGGGEESGPRASRALPGSRSAGSLRLIFEAPQVPAQDRPGCSSTMTHSGRDDCCTLAASYFENAG